MNSQIREAAAHWLVEFRTETADVATRRQFAAWLRTSPEHIKAYLDVLALWEDAQGCDPQRRLDVDALVSLAHTERTIPGIQADDSPDAPARKPILGRLLRPRTAVAVVLSLVINFGATWIAVDPLNVAYTTQIAEQRSVGLSDGSRIDLDALSNVRVNFTSQERTLELLSGQALFHVTKDTKRPFVVVVDGARIRAVGTQFDVNRTTLGTVLTVLEGRVTVLVPAVPIVRVDAGQQATILHGTISVPQAVDITAATGWMRRLLVFSSTPLPEAAEEFNRFNNRRLVIASPTLADFHVTGTFRAFDPQSLADFVLFLRRQPQLEVLERDDQIRVGSRVPHP